ncbi:MAG: hypothetical protein PHH85_13605 [Candidatus Methanoperedens sp.]|nr:hypothetical protein [Candidatus Methanoperedens sp.]
MKKVHIVIIVVALISVSVIFGLFEPRKSIFTERLGDMTLTRYETGETAKQQISNIFALKDIPLEKGYSAVYQSNKGTMHMWVAEPYDHNVANNAFITMNSMLGGPKGKHDEHENSGEAGQTDSHNEHDYSKMMNGSFTTPEIIDITEFEIPSVYMMKANNSFNYYYFKMNYNKGRVYWIIFDSYDTEYQLSVVKQAVMKI